MKFRLTDEKDWAHEFNANTPEELQAGIRAAWDARAQGMHPWELKSRLDEIDDWLASRMAKGGTEEQVRSWQANAEHRRFRARQELTSDLFLHVFADLSGQWNTIASRMKSGRWSLMPGWPKVDSRKISIEDATIIFSGATVTLEHLKNLWGMADGVTDAIRKVQYPPPTLVKNPSLKRRLMR